MDEWGGEPSIMLHEAAFAGLFGWMWVRLVGVAGLFAPGSLTYAALLLAVPGLAITARLFERKARLYSRPGTFQSELGRWAGRVRLFAYVPTMCFVFQDFRRTAPLLHPGHVDGLLQRLDLRLFGVSLPQWFDGRVGAVPTEALSLCYGLFFVYLLAATVGWLFAPARVARAFYGGLFTLYALGFAGYAALPALGPYATMAFHADVHGFALTRLLLATVPLGTNRADAFPSLHCAVTAFILGFDWLSGHRRRACWCAAPVAGLWLSTLVLRFHYGVDVLAGFGLAAGCLAATAALLRPRRRPGAARAVSFGRHHRRKGLPVSNAYARNVEEF